MMVLIPFLYYQTENRFSPAIGKKINSIDKKVNAV